MKLPRRHRHPAGKTSPQHPLFDETWYLNSYPEVANYNGKPWEHFTRHGDSEGRRPGPGFDPEFYRRTYIKLEEQPTTAALEHFTLYGEFHGHVPRPTTLTPMQSTSGIQLALSGRRNPIILVGHDAQRAGAPILLLRIAEGLRDRGLSPVFLLHRGGPLLDDYRALGPTLILDEGWDTAALAGAIPPTVAVVGSTCWSAPVLVALRHRGPILLLLHEMPQYIAEHDLFDAISQLPHVAVAMPGMKSLVVDRVGDTTEVHVIQPGLFAKTSTARERAAVRKALGVKRGIKEPVFISAGFADERKGFDRFVEAARAIYSSAPSSRFVWLGAGSVWARTLAEEAQREGLPLITPGFQSNPTAWYENATVYLLTSRQDPGPSTVMDAALVGVPFVGYNGDIGLRGLGDALDGVGTFEINQDAYVAKALELAFNDTDQTRANRAAHVAAHSSMNTYLREIVGTLRRQGSIINAAPLGPLRRRTQRAAHGVSTVYLDSLQLLRLTQVRVTRVIRKQWRRRPTRPLAIAIGSPMPHQQVSETAIAQVQALRPGQRKWLESTSLLPYLVTPATVVLGREGAQSDPLVLQHIEQASLQIRALAQFDSLNPPLWATKRILPRQLPIDTSQPTVPHAHFLTPTVRPTLERPIGVFVHMFHAQLAESIVNRLALISHDMELYISTDTEHKARLIRSLAPNAEVRVLENLGRDLYPKLYGFRDVYQDHDIVLHLHSKLPPAKGVREGWFDYILDRLLPSSEGIDAILALLTSIDSLGMVSPTTFPEVRTGAGWGPNRALAEAVVWGAGWPTLPSSQELRFPVGSMFWGRTAALKPLLDLNLPPSAFSNDARRDGTLAHTLERLLGVSCLAAGFEQIFVDGYIPVGAPTSASIEAVAQSLRMRGST